MAHHPDDYRDGGPGRRVADRPEPGIKILHIWLAVVVMCGTVIVTAWQTAISVGERAGEGNATLRQIGAAVEDLSVTMKTVVSEQQQIRMDVQRLDNTTVKYDNAPQPRERTSGVKPGRMFER